MAAVSYKTVLQYYKNLRKGLMTTGELIPKPDILSYVQKYLFKNDEPKSNKNKDIHI